MKPTFLLAVAMAAACPAMAQVAIAPSNTTPDASAALDVQHTSKGVLIPRLVLTSATSASPITAPAQGLLVYNTADTIYDGAVMMTPARGFYNWTGTRWDAVASNGANGAVPRGAILTFDEKLTRPGYAYLGYEVADFANYIGSGFGTWNATPAIPTNNPVQKAASTWYGGKLFVWSGQDNNYFSYDNTGAAYNPATSTWTSMTTIGAPTGRFGAATVTDPSGGWMMVWGGITTFTGAGTIPTVDGTGGVYDLLYNNWSAMAASPLAARAGHAAVWTGLRMVIWGGYNAATATNYGDGALYNLSNNTWTSMAASPLAPRRGHSAVWTGTRMIVWGGTNGSTIFNDGAAYDPATNTWTTIAPSAAISATHSHSVVWTGTEMIVFGGSNLYGATEFGARYNPSSNTWSSLPASPGTPAIALTSTDHLALWTGTEMVVVGGHNTTVGSLDVVRAFNPSANTWRLYNPLPQPRRGTVGAWTGSQILVHGGGIQFGNDVAFSGTTTSYIFDPATGAPQDVHSQKSVRRYLYKKN